MKKEYRLHQTTILKSNIKKWTLFSNLTPRNQLALSKIIALSYELCKLKEMYRKALDGI